MITDEQHLESALTKLMRFNHNSKVIVINLAALCYDEYERTQLVRTYQLDTIDLYLLQRIGWDKSIYYLITENYKIEIKRSDMLINMYITKL